MKKDELFERMSAAYQTCLRIVEAKNRDYASDADPFANFRLIEQFSDGKISAEYGILTRCSDKFKRIMNLLDKPNDVADESIDDTINDLCNYLQILKLYRRSKLDNDE